MRTFLKGPRPLPTPPIYPTKLAFQLSDPLLPSLTQPELQSELSLSSFENLRPEDKETVVERSATDETEMLDLLEEIKNVASSPKHERKNVSIRSPATSSSSNGNGNGNTRGRSASTTSQSKKYVSRRDVEDQLVAVTHEVDAKDTQINYLKAIIKSLRSQIVFEREKFDEMKETEGVLKIDSLISTLETGRIHEQEDVIKYLEETIGKLKLQLDDAEELVSRKDHSNALLKKEAEIAKERATDLDKALLHKENAINNLQAMIRKLEMVEVAGREKTISDLRVELARCQNQIHQQHHQLQRSGSVLGGYSSSPSSASHVRNPKDIETIANLQAQLSHHIATSDAQLHAKNNEIERLSHQLATLQTELNKHMQLTIKDYFGEHASLNQLVHPHDVSSNSPTRAVNDHTHAGCQVIISTLSQSLHSTKDVIANLEKAITDTRLQAHENLIRKTEEFSGLQRRFEDLHKEYMSKVDDNERFCANNQFLETQLAETSIKLDNTEQLLKKFKVEVAERDRLLHEAKAKHSELEVAIESKNVEVDKFGLKQVLGLAKVDEINRNITEIQSSIGTLQDQIKRKIHQEQDQFMQLASHV